MESLANNHYGAKWEDIDRSQRTPQSLPEFEFERTPFNTETAITTYQSLILELPNTSRHTLLYILDLLAVFASKSEVNRMTTPRLAALFQPGLLGSALHLLQAKEIQLSQDVLIYLVEHQDYWIIGMKAPDIKRVDIGGMSPHVTLGPGAAV